MDTPEVGHRLHSIHKRLQKSDLHTTKFTDRLQKSDYLSRPSIRKFIVFTFALQKSVVSAFSIQSL